MATESVKVEIIKAEAFEIDPDKKYLIILGKNSRINQDGVRAFSKRLREGLGVNNFLIIHDADKIKIVESE